MREISGKFFIFQQDSARAHARETMRLLERQTHAFNFTRPVDPSKPG